MLLSKTFWKTYKEAPKDAEIPSHILMMRAGLIHKTGSGLYTYLPFAMKVLRKIEKVISEELEAINCNEIAASFETPAKLWQESKRWDAMGPEMLRLKDRKDQDYCLSPTNEESFTDVIRSHISSYKELPVSLFQMNTKFRDEIRPRFGLMRCKEFKMKDAYTFALTKSELDEQYEEFYQAYTNIFKRLGLEFYPVEADGGAMADAGAQTHEFQVVADTGEDEIVFSGDGYAANIEKAQTKRLNLELVYDLSLAEVETPHKKSCKDVADFLKLPITQTLKSKVVTVDYGKKQVTYLVLLLGDDELNELKLKSALKAKDVRPATTEELDHFKFIPGFIGPIGKEISVLFDEAVDPDACYVVGANKDNYHMQGFCPTRDLKKFKTLDLRLAKTGDVSLSGSPIEIRRGVEVGHIFQLGDKYTKAMAANVLDESGKRVFPLMGCYGIGITRTMAAAIEQSHDDAGIIWPKEIAPFDIHLCSIGKKEDSKKQALSIYDSLIKAGFEVLYDDRGLGPGAMFKDADLLGLPVRVLFGERDFEQDGLIEVKLRKSGESFKVAPLDLPAKLKYIFQDP